MNSTKRICIAIFFYHKVPLYLKILLNAILPQRNTEFFTENTNLFLAKSQSRKVYFLCDFATLRD
ncbi:hypothetical protein FLA105534_02627 [Flavobacterium bizetiae]|uniref:Uncharacterized protein n=1 Tax=Flavobacterium bizetiae TaxID=2704140 RepID=A0A6J4GN13_9FLAO|nr:hypothetical protein FLA105534_02627 [Flavobacterium bizetiae]CAD5346081.1 hypothetical protein FLA105534_00019 [Flavobacterium bizetiae]